jgi:signal transduction histidine kinase
MISGLSLHQTNRSLIEQHQRGTLASGIHSAPNFSPGQPESERTSQSAGDTEIALVWQYSELERQRKENAAILDAAEEALVLISADHRIVMANIHFCDMLGAPRDEILGIHVHQIRPLLLTIFGSELVCNLLRWRSGPVPDDKLEIQQVFPNARIYQLAIRDAGSPDADGFGRLFAFRDITHDRELDRLKDEFVATVSHELRTPLTSIAGFLDLLTRGSAGELPAQAQSFLGIIQRNVTGLISQVNELLEFSSVEAGGVSLEFERVSVRSAINEAIAMVSPMLAERGQRLAIDLPDALPQIRADRGRLVQVLMNLLSNANRYTPAGGIVSVSARQDAHVVRFDVVDTGIGINAEDCELIFTRFYRVKGNSNPEMGSGLGLPIARSLVERMGGQIGVQSVPGKGSTFSFTIPIARTSAERDLRALPRQQ